ncbi:unnamed protein product, partial [Urochloa humidicola]
GVTQENTTPPPKNNSRSAGSVHGSFKGTGDPKHPSVVENGVTQESTAPPPNNDAHTNTQRSIVDGPYSLPQRSAQSQTSDDMAEDDGDENVIFEDDEEEEVDEGYLFTGQEDDEDV